MKITNLGPVRPFEISVKRLYLPFRVEDDCPECGKRCVHDLNSDYLSYPVLGEPIHLSFYCEDGHEVEEWTQTVVLNVTLEPAPE